MKAVQFDEHGGPEVLGYADFPEPTVGDDEVLVEVRAAALNHLDVWTRRGTPSPGEFPHVPGSDAAGVVTEVGTDVTRLDAGDHVVVDANLSCGECEFCAAGERSMCEEFRIVGEHVRGVQSERVALPADRLVAVPESVDFTTAAAAPLVFQTAWRMLVTRADVDPGDLVLVHGASGGVGHAAVQIAAFAGCEVWATASSQAKLDHARDCGADHAVNYEERDFVEAVEADTGGRGVDVVVDHVGAATWRDSIAALANGGTLATCGATTGPNPETDLSRIFWNQLEVVGSTMATRGELERVLELVWDGTFEPAIRATLPMSEVARGHRMLEDREGFGKVVLVPDAAGGG